ncbi:hypothetical protein H4219_004792 [Mycoemilia scoparia]|uniref:RRM domain-containing protein n=1 Tax=Mycoemilia scoparia TaxID=417184 RepID=A0A9W7ZQF2_9FUNG|nr:hypothetical protein H4219_004792 [Mycoemilia scoparia]
MPDTSSTHSKNLVIPSEPLRLSNSIDIDTINMADSPAATFVDTERDSWADNSDKNPSPQTQTNKSNGDGWDDELVENDAASKPDGDNTKDSGDAWGDEPVQNGSNNHNEDSGKGGSVDPWNNVEAEENGGSSGQSDRSHEHQQGRDRGYDGHEREHSDRRPFPGHRERRGHSRSLERRRNDDYPPRRSMSRGRRFDDGFRRERRRLPENGTTEPSNELAVFGISSDTDREHLERFFSKYGRVEKAHIPGYNDPVTNARVHRGFGFVTMESLDAAIEAVKDAPGREINGRAIRVDYNDGRRRGNSRDFRDMHGRRRVRHSDRYGREDFHRDRSRPRYEPYPPRYEEGRGGRYGGDRPRYEPGPPPPHHHHHRHGSPMRDSRSYHPRDRFDDRPPRHSRSPRGRRYPEQDRFEDRYVGRKEPSWERNSRGRGRGRGGSPHRNGRDHSPRHTYAH